MNKNEKHLKEKADIRIFNYDVDFLETLVYEWVRRWIYFKNFRLSNSILKSTANRFKTILNLKSFSPNNEWLQKFRITYNLKDMNTAQQLAGISYNCFKSILPVDIFNELQPNWVSLDPRSADAQIVTLNLAGVEELVAKSGSIEVNKTKVTTEDVLHEDILDFHHKQNEYMVEDTLPRDEKRINYESTFNDDTANDTNSNELVDIEDELPVCTIFGRKTVENVANIITFDKNSKEDTFQPMIVCTDPKNPNRNTMDTLSFNSTSQIETEETLFFKPMSLSKLRIRKTNLKQQKNTKLQSDQLAEAFDTGSLDSNKLPSTKPNLKRKILPKLVELPKDINSQKSVVEKTHTITHETTNNPLLNQTKINIPLINQSTINQPTVNSTPTALSVESSRSLQKIETINQMPTVVQQAWDPSTFQQNITLANLPGEITSETQRSLVVPGRIMYTFQMPAACQNQITMPYVSPITNMSTTTFGHPTTLSPIVLHFQSPMTLQTTEMLPGSAISSALMSLPQTSPISDTPFIPSIDLTQQINSTHITDLTPNQCMPLITMHAQQTLSNQTPSVVTSPTTFTTTTTQKTPILGVLPSNSKLTKTLTPYVSYLKQITLNQQNKEKRIQTTVSTKTPTASTSTSCSALITPKTYLPNVVPTKIEPTTTMPTNTMITQTACSENYVPTTTTYTAQVPVSTTSSTINSTLLPSTTTIKILPKSATNSTPKTTNSMQFTITKKTRLNTTDPNMKKGTKYAQRQPLKNDEEVLKCIRLMEDFAMINENFRLIGFLERLEQQINLNKKKSFN